MAIHNLQPFSPSFSISPDSPSLSPSPSSPSSSPHLARQQTRPMNHSTLVKQPTTTHLSRAKTLTRPERHVNPAPLINPNSSAAARPGFSDSHSSSQPSPWYHPWRLYVTLLSLPIPACLLSACGIKDSIAQAAWREKLALCSIALFAGIFTAFVTVAMNRVLCPPDQLVSDRYIVYGDPSLTLGLFGWAFNTSQAATGGPVNFNKLALEQSGQDISSFFDRSHLSFPECQAFLASRRSFATSNLCSSINKPNGPCLLPSLNPQTLESLKLVNTSHEIGYSWSQLIPLNYTLVLNGIVLNLESYISSTTPNPSDKVDSAIRVILSNPQSMGKDATRLFTNSDELRASVSCLQSRFRAGVIDKITPGCFASQLFLYVSLVVILGVVLVRFVMAVIFSWFISHRLVKPPRNLRRKVISPAVLPVGANLSLTNANGTAPWVRDPSAGHITKHKPLLSEKTSLLGVSPLFSAKSSRQNLSSPATATTPVKPVDAQGYINQASIGAELFCVCLVTCYSEGAEGISKTLDSIAATDYADSRKLLFIVCDGMITGHGEKSSTPDICVAFIEPDDRFADPMPMSYRAVAAGAKEHNQAMVYAARVKGHRTPTIVIVKSGTPEEARTEKKPGNRGKRDSQMILMNFFSRVTYNDRMTPLDYDLFRKMQALMGVTPDFFEVCLMVDADTTVDTESLRHLVNCMQHDPYIMGVCGETRIANKKASWVTSIQVFEYYISHHLTKAFESVFGGVTCLPGCFSMYRLKARRTNESDWIPILAQPEICREYSQCTVTTLHQKNLLLLGEDRFLTTLMIRTFPFRKMMFCPQAKCRTTVPDQFKVLLSQRRRWINSTIHNLMELVRVPNLCGTFCFSMQFVVFMELTGTIVLPIAISLTYSLIINSIINPPRNFADAIPLILLGAILGLPALLILLTSRKISYVFWMLVYLVALPVWNFVLPLYAFWHFDDFSWGETRKVEGDRKGAGDHSSQGDGQQIDADTVPSRRWEDWERSRLKKMKREAKRRREFERAFGIRQFHNGNSTIAGSEFGAGDTISEISSSDDDRWGVNVGNYNEQSDVICPPVGLYRVDDGSSSGETVNGDELQVMLETGWEDSDQAIEPPNHHHHDPLTVLGSYHHDCHSNDNRWPNSTTPALQHRLRGYESTSSELLESTKSF